ncbi:hypothetical protein [Massilia genomosp. 1]|uniref:WD40 repeat domain-containing protein n=1 Tax=Massilia genomosp. 1 TaxID=2609280 RepID=A0ABX0MUU4_9BURK|nr:hypothetical protein [Massilia genomosp. 1]NHZ63064.1 hypothetical protein [Massilia genomosp. 1]
MTSPQAEWQKHVLGYADAINDYVRIGLADGWDKAGEEPSMPPMAHLLPHWLEALQEVNQPGKDQAAHDAFRQAWPPAHAPLADLLDAQGIKSSELLLLDDGSMLLRAGAPYQDGPVLHLQGATCTDVEGIDFIGRCPQRRYFATCNDEGVTVTDGWLGPKVVELAWPTGHEDLPEGMEGEDLEDRPRPTRLIPFPDGQRVLLVSSVGIYVLAAGGARRLWPTAESLEEDGLPVRLDMEHGAISPDGKWIAVGGQDGAHQVFDAQLNMVSSIGPVGEYPHYAAFSGDSQMAIFNACHFYEGATLAVDVKDFPGLDTDFYNDDPRTPTVQEGARVYAAVHRQGEFIVGDAQGYLRAFGPTGRKHWHHFVGSTVMAMDISADGNTLVVSTCAGFISTIRLDAGKAAPWQIGSGGHRELQRWLFWASFGRPLLW